MANPSIWFRRNNGDWNGNPSADPTTQVGGFDISSITGPYLPFISGTTGSLHQFITTINCTGSFAFTAPPGSTPLGSSITWNPADKTSGIVLDSGNLEAICNGLGIFGNSGWVRATSGTPVDGGGLQYFELTCVEVDFVGEFFGVANAAASISTGGNAGAGVGTICFNNGGGLVIGLDTTLGTLGAASTGDVIGIAIFTEATPPTPPTPNTAVAIPLGLGQWRGACGINWQGMALVGDAFTNVVGLSNFEIFQEYGNPMLMLATTPPIQKDRKRISITRFELEVEAGLGIPGEPSVAPLMVLDYSKNGGITWENLQIFRSMGAAGEYIKRLRWINLGNSRSWVFRFQYSDSARPTIIGTYYDLFQNLG